MMTETLGVDEKPHPDSVTSGSPTGGAQHDSNIMTAQMLSMMPLPYTHTLPSPLTPSSTRPSSSIRPYKCNVCHRSFREVATLRKHEQLHRADRPYVCTTCSKSFLWSSNLKVHERVHTGERPYTCGICQRRFTQSNDLRRHERNVHMHHKHHHHSRGGGGSSGNSPTHPSQHHHKSHGSAASSSTIDGAIGSSGGSTSPQSTTMSLPPVSSAVAAVSSHLATSGQVNMAAYQALALQQRAALLQQAMAYESMMQSAGVSPTVSSSMLPHSTAVMSAPVLPHLSPPVRHSLSASAESAPTSSTSHFIKTEQITPPPTPISIMLGSVKTTALPPIEQLRGSVSGGSAAVSTTGQFIALPMPFIQATLSRSASVQSNESSSLPPTLSPSPTIQSPPISQSAALAMAAQLGVAGLTSPPNLVSQLSAGVHHVTGMSPTYGLTLPQAHQNRLNIISSSYGKPDSSGENGVDLRTNKATDHHHGHHHHTSSDHSEEEIMDADDDAEIQRSSKYGKGSPKEDSNSTSPSSKSSSKDNSQSSDAEGDEKRDVTTTSGYPTGPDGFFRCVHCDVYFREFTMYHLHQSLHIPDADDPFICPSCGKRCADRIEFTFHLVWHVRYPHTIPNYQPFHSSYIMGCSSNC